MDRPDLAATQLEIKAHGEQQQRLGDIAHEAGRNEEAQICYARAKIARDKGMLLHGYAESSNPDYCYTVQKLLTSADLYGLVLWRLTETDEED